MKCASCDEMIGDRMVTVTEEQDVTTKTTYLDGSVERQLRPTRLAVYCSYRCVGKGIETLEAEEAKEEADAAF